MNWTGGRLPGARKSHSSSKAVVNKQKQHFARLRARLHSISSPPAASFRPDFLQNRESAVGNHNRFNAVMSANSRARQTVLEEYASTAPLAHRLSSMARSSRGQDARSRKRPQQSSVPHSRQRSSHNTVMGLEHPLPRLKPSLEDHPERSVITDTLEGKKRRLLMQPDWVGLGPSRPVRLNFSSHDSRGHLGKRHRAVREIRHIRACTPAGSMLPPPRPAMRDQDDGEYMMSGALRTDDQQIRVRIGIGALESQATPVIPSMAVQVTPQGLHCQSSDTMLFEAAAGRERRAMDGPLISGLQTRSQDPLVGAFPGAPGSNRDIVVSSKSPSDISVQASNDFEQSDDVAPGKDIAPSGRATPMAVHTNYSEQHDILTDTLKSSSNNLIQTHMPLLESMTDWSAYEIPRLHMVHDVTVNADRNIDTDDLWCRYESLENGARSVDPATAPHPDAPWWEDDQGRNQRLPLPRNIETPSASSDEVENESPLMQKVQRNLEMDRATVVSVPKTNPTNHLSSTHLNSPSVEQGNESTLQNRAFHVLPTSKFRFTRLPSTGRANATSRATKATSKPVLRRSQDTESSVAISQSPSKSLRNLMTLAEQPTIKENKGEKRKALEEKNAEKAWMTFILGDTSSTSTVDDVGITRNETTTRGDIEVGRTAASSLYVQAQSLPTEPTEDSSFRSTDDHLSVLEPSKQELSNLSKLFTSSIEHANLKTSTSGKRTDVMRQQYNEEDSNGHSRRPPTTSQDAQPGESSTTGSAPASTLSANTANIVQPTDPAGVQPAHRIKFIRPPRFIGSSVAATRGTYNGAGTSSFTTNSTRASDARSVPAAAADSTAAAAGDSDACVWGSASNSAIGHRACERRSADGKVAKGRAGGSSTMSFACSSTYDTPVSAGEDPIED